MGDGRRRMHSASGVVLFCGGRARPHQQHQGLPHLPEVSDQLSRASASGSHRRRRRCELSGVVGAPRQGIQMANAAWGDLQNLRGGDVVEQPGQVQLAGAECLLATGQRPRFYSGRANVFMAESRVVLWLQSRGFIASASTASRCRSPVQTASGNPP